MIKSQTISENILKTFLTDRKSNSLYDIDGIIICNDTVNPVNKDKNPKWLLI